MKKLIFVFFLAGVVYAQNTDKAVATATTEKELIRKVVENTNETVRVDFATSVATLVSAVKSISTASDTLVSVSTACKWVSITNFTAGSTLYIGGSAVSTANGFPLLYLDSITFAIKDLIGVYAIGSTTISVRYLYGN